MPTHPHTGAGLARPQSTPDPFAEVARLRHIADTAQDPAVRRGYEEYARQVEAEIMAKGSGTPTLTKRYRSIRDRDTGAVVTFDTDKDSPQSLRATAEKFRRLADTAEDPGTRTSYTALARELEDTARTQGAA